MAKGETPGSTSTSVGPPAHLPLCLALSLSLQMIFLILPHLYFSHFITVRISFPAAISSSPWKPSMHNMLIPLKKFSFDTAFSWSLCFSSLFPFKAELLTRALSHCHFRFHSSSSISTSSYTQTRHVLRSAPAPHTHTVVIPSSCFHHITLA